ncbi:MAG: ATP phosphoribosyltransferase regulatory subunit [Dehalococcoidales bacterium]|nr:ATP phosphoribosyltransferase regulatory subunit [Dehalococcoidales bacterium]
MIQHCKGFKDMLPQEMAAFRKVESAFLQAASGWGYQEVRTPTIEYLYLFTSAGTLTPGKLRRTYSFLDWDGWSGERVVLRPDATIPVARMYAECLADKPQTRLSYIANTFMFDDTGKKNRERWQLGAEYIGSSSALADAELVALALEVTEQLAVPKVRIRLSHSGLIAALLEQSGFKAEEYNSIFDELLDGNEGAMERVKEASPQLARLFSLMLTMKGKSAGYLKNLKALLDETLTGAKCAIDDFVATTEAIQALGVEYEINLAAAKGYEYYTGIIFHVLSGDEIIGGGGRYDNLISLLGGKDVPAAGFGLYMDKLIGLSGFRLEESKQADSIMITNTGNAINRKIEVARKLRQAGYSVTLASENQEKICNRFCITVSDNLLDYVLHDNSTGSRINVPAVEDLCDILAKGDNLD